MRSDGSKSEQSTTYCPHVCRHGGIALLRIRCSSGARAPTWGVTSMRSGDGRWAVGMPAGCAASRQSQVRRTSTLEEVAASAIH